MESSAEKQNNPLQKRIKMLYYSYNERELSEVEDFVRSTRRWYDRGNPRDAGEAYACRIALFHVMMVIELVI